MFVLGGAKIADAFMMMSTVLGRGIADKVLTGGLVANILLAAKGVNIGEASLDFIKKQGYDGFIESAKTILARYRDELVLPVDLAYRLDEERKEAAVSALPGDRCW